MDAAPQTLDRFGRRSGTLRAAAGTFSLPPVSKRRWGRAIPGRGARTVYPERGASLVRWILIFICSVVLAAGGSSPVSSQATAAKTAPSTAMPAPPAALLPDSFAGWVSAGTPENANDPVQADAPNASALKEYGFNLGERASYKRSGETLTLRALRFNDASGAYGAYSYYRQSSLPKEEIGTGAASDHNRVIFWLGSTV